MDDDDLHLGTLLRGHAERMTEHLTDSSAAYAAVARRARARRSGRMAIVGALTAAAAVAGVLIVASATGDQATVLTPATSPAPPSAPPTSAVGPTTAPATVSPAPTTAPAVTATFPATTVPVQPAPPTTETYGGIGGSITVRLGGGVLSLVGDPSPSPGFTTRVDDNGPDRVRVRFERDDARTEIRVDVEDGQLVPEIIED